MTWWAQLLEYTRSVTEQIDDENAPRGSFWRRLTSGLGKTRTQLAAGVGNLLLGEKEIDEVVLEELETALLLTDVGIDATREIMDALTAPDYSLLAICAGTSCRSE